MPKFCPKCKQDKSHNDFSKNRSKPDGLAPWCKPCNRAYHREWSKENYSPAQRRDHDRRWRYGITPDDFDSMMLAQGGKCAVCAKDFTEIVKPAVDHDHSCCPGKVTCGKCVRGLLCGNCNMAIGLLGDDPDRALAVAAYLRGLLG